MNKKQLYIFIGLSIFFSTGEILLAQPDHHSKTSDSSRVTFPIKVSANSRYLVDQTNKPFPILGRTAWFIISQPVDIKGMGETVEAAWFDPTSGDYFKIQGSPFKNNGNHKFTPSGKNSNGQADWVLVLKSGNKIKR